LAGPLSAFRNPDAVIPDADYSMGIFLFDGNTDHARPSLSPNRSHLLSLIGKHFVKLNLPYPAIPKSIGI
jgi:hypothetical protein